jgi:hypothetical protein
MMTVVIMIVMMVVVVMMVMVMMVFIMTMTVVDGAARVSAAFGIKRGFDFRQLDRKL